MKNFALLILILTISSLISGCFNSDDNYISIQEKIDNSNDGDIIFIKSGIYNEKLIINKSITIIGENKNNTIIDCKNINGFKPINVILINSNNCTIKGFKITNSNILNNTTGIKINSSNNIIENNSISKMSQAIHLNIETYQNNISNNNIFNNQIGIKLTFSHNNNISKNNLYLNSVNGIKVDFQSMNNQFFKNNIKENKYGIHLTEGIYNRIIKNNFICNQKGLYLCCEANNNTIYYNFFIKNSENNARCTTDNRWYFKSVGNYWDDYIGIDNNKDGFGDIPYNIPGGKCIDPFPLIDYI